MSSVRIVKIYDTSWIFDSVSEINVQDNIYLAEKNVIASVVISKPLKSLIDTAWRQHSRTVKMTSDRR